MSSRAVAVGVVRGAYAERAQARLPKLDLAGDRLLHACIGAVETRQKPWNRAPALVDARAGDLSAAADGALGAEADRLRTELLERGFADDLVARSFALVREAASRNLGQRHYDVQLVGGWVLLRGMVAEMEAGEGKTLTATLPACTAALAGIPVHVITVNDYLARRDAQAMGPVYRALGLSVGVVTSGMDPGSRRAGYGSDVTYVTNKEIVFDYLKDRIALGPGASQLRLRVERLCGGRTEQRLLLRGLHFAIVDEADSVLIDEARTPLIISGQSRDTTQEEVFRIAVQLARALERDRDFEVDEQERRIVLLERGSQRLSARGDEIGGVFRGRKRREELVRLALSALHCFRRDHQYLVKDDKIQIIDEYTGRVMPDRSWELGLHQMIEAKEGLPISVRPETLARISYQRFFRRYLRLAGMTGTAREVRGELAAVYRLHTVRVPTNRPLRRSWLGVHVLPSADEKWERIGERVAELHARGRPVLVGTRSVAASELLSARLDARAVPHRVLNARQDHEEAEIVTRAGEPGRVTVATNMAGRGTDIRLGEGVAETGGLHVIASERHEAGRIDRQLFGRCGRQGDPGSFESFLSLEDELLEAHAHPLARRLASHGAARSGSRLARALVELAFWLAQRRAEWLHSRARRDLLKMDEQLERLLAFSGRFE